MVISIGQNCLKKKERIYSSSENSKLYIIYVIKIKKWKKLCWFLLQFEGADNQANSPTQGPDTT